MVMWTTGPMTPGIGGQPSGTGDLTPLQNLFSGMNANAANGTSGELPSLFGALSQMESMLNSFFTSGISQIESLFSGAGNLGASDPQPVPSGGGIPPRGGVTPNGIAWR